MVGEASALPTAPAPEVLVLVLRVGMELEVDEEEGEMEGCPMEGGEPAEGENACGRPSGVGIAVPGA